MATIGCEIQPHSGSQMSQTGAPGATLTFQFDIVDISGGCSSFINGTVIAGADTTGGASANPLAWSGSVGSVISINVTTGPTAGGSAVYTIDCPSSSCYNGNSSIVITAANEDSWSLTANTPTLPRYSGEDVH